MLLAMRTELEELFDWDEEDLSAALDITREMFEQMFASGMVEQAAAYAVAQMLMNAYNKEQANALVAYFIAGALNSDTTPEA